MRRIMKRGWIILLVGVLLVAGAVTVWAQGPATNNNGEERAWPGRGGPAVRCDVSTEALQALNAKVREILAGKLGLTVEELQSACGPRGYFPGLKAQEGVDLKTWREAFQSAREEGLAAAVKEGILTQEQADCLAQPKAPLGMGRMMFRAPNMPLYDWMDMDQSAWREAQQSALASALGMTTDELQSALQEGKTLRSLIEEKGLTVEKVQEAMQAAFEKAVKQALAEGRITAAQAEKLLNLKVGAGPAWGGRGGFPGGRGMGRGGMMRHGAWPNGTPTPTPNTSS